MSGGYEHGSYDIFVPQTAKGKYQKYATELVAIVSSDRHKNGDVKSAKLYLTKAVDEFMGRPPLVKLGTSGTNVGIIPIDENDGEGYVVTRKVRHDGNGGMPFVNMTAFCKFVELAEGVYSAHKEPGA